MSDLNFITFTNKGYVDYTRNLLISNKKNDVNENIKVYALDEYSHNIFSDLHDKVELYNLEDDISETKDLSAIDIKKKTELLNQLNEWVKKTNAPIPSVFND